ncbi:GNAT family N-acetyltransferase [Sutcliffiella cohnii]|uniref:GNAT family N-acetyltransferase n=1 Tax=Sutcliffiella cohnii TaxID=33932 RepID=A0A223KRB2_9BACI|nr:GNAT family N-acetyltransferase [Sutcliffiella cohnii]AST91863.1 GNAT family N-acetyltransferase [Sutcliffiella cohnii]
MYFKKLYVFDNDQPKLAIIRNYKESDFTSLMKVQEESFPPPFPSELWWNEEQLSNHVKLFPEGALCIEVDGRIAGSMTGLIVDYHNEDHTWEDITDNGYIRNHNDNGNTLYVVDICVSPQYRKLGLGKHLMQSMYEIVIEKKLTRLLGGGRMPGFHKQAESLTPSQYFDAVVKGELKDPVITFLLRAGRTPVKVVENYLEDADSCNYGALMEWKNPFIKIED